MDETSLRSAMGSLAFWGATPAYDLRDFLTKEITEELMEHRTIHFLLLGQADARHILNTLSLCKETEQSNASFKQLEFYIVESHPVLYARQLLLIHLAFLPLEEIGLHEKTTQFMEIFGNINIRPQTKNTIRNACQALIKFVTDDKRMREKLPMINLDNLKHREKDQIVEILNFWSDAQITSVDIQHLWDLRLRQYLTGRYDTRVGSYDWDYHMRMLEKNKSAGIINIKEYQIWRNSGQAFTAYESDYNQPNVTLLSSKGQPYQGDMLIGPFIAFGIDPKDSSLLEKVNDQHKNKSLDITFDNLQNIFSILSPKEQKLFCKDFKIHFLPLDTDKNLWKKSKFLAKFDAAYFSNFIGQKIRPELIKLLKPNATVFVDLTRFIWYFREENDKAYEKKILELCDAAGLQILPMNKNPDTGFLKFAIRENAETEIIPPDELNNGQGDGV